MQSNVVAAAAGGFVSDVRVGARACQDVVACALRACTLSKSTVLIALARRPPGWSGRRRCTTTLR
jgi:hypothetical protein